MYGWKSNNERDVELVLQEQTTFTQNHFEQRCNNIIVQFAEQVSDIENSQYAEIYFFILRV